MIFDVNQTEFVSRYQREVWSHGTHVIPLDVSLSKITDPETIEGCKQVYEVTMEILTDMYNNPQDYERVRPNDYLELFFRWHADGKQRVPVNVQKQKGLHEHILNRLERFGFVLNGDELTNDRYPLFISYRALLNQSFDYGSTISCDFRLLTKPYKRSTDDLLRPLPDKYKTLWRELFEYARSKGAKLESRKDHMFRWVYDKRFVLVLTNKPPYVEAPYQLSNGGGDRRQAFALFLELAHRQPDADALVKYIQDNICPCTGCPGRAEGRKPSNMYEADTEAAERVKLMFEMYSEPETSFGDIARYFSGEGIGSDGKEFSRNMISQLLKNPVYAQADIDVYEFFKSQGAAIVNDAADFTGLNGCYLFQGRDVAESKKTSLKEQILVVAPHEGLVSSDIWLAVRKKLMNNTNSSFRSGRKVATTWLAGKIKCGRCGTGLTCICSPLDVLYFRCRKRADRKSCEGCGTLHVKEVEHFIYDEMCRMMDEFKTLTDGNPAKANSKLTAYKVELAQVEAEIEKLFTSLTGANAVLMSYANSKIEELDAKRQSLMKTIAEQTAGAVSPNKLNQISGYLNDWANVDITDRRFVVDGLINQINITSETVKIEWKI